jgi:hypothetical protein
MFLEAIVCKRALKALLMASRKSACFAKSKKKYHKTQNEVQVFLLKDKLFCRKTASKQKACKC